MPQTVMSGSAAYCTAQQFIDRFDYRSVGRLLSDDGTGLSQAAVLASTVLRGFLMEYSGRVEAACLAGARYSVADLQALQSPTMTNGGETLAGLVADMTMWRIWRRREKPVKDAPVDYAEVQRILKALNDGEEIFGLQETADAGHLHHELIDVSDVLTRNDRTIQAGRYFGQRSDQDPRNPTR